MSKPYNIRSTTDYSAFKRITGNRIVRPSHVKRLKLAIEKNPDTIKYNPILVNEQMEIIDGQHRYEACKALELPIYYVVVDGLKLGDVQMLNSVAKTWQPIDYAQAFSELGNENYKYYLEIKRSDLSLNHDSLLRYLSLHEPSTSVGFTEGKLKVPDIERSIELLTQLHGMAEFYVRYNTRPFALAYLKFATEDEYEHKRMMKQMRSYSNLIEDYAKEQDYFKALNRVYNWNKSERNKKFFGTLEYLMEK